MTLPTTVVANDGVHRIQGGLVNHVADDVLVGEAVTFAAGGVVLMGTLEIAQKES